MLYCGFALTLIVTGLRLHLFEAGKLWLVSVSQKQHCEFLRCICLVHGVTTTNVILKETDLSVTFRITQEDASFLERMGRKEICEICHKNILYVHLLLSYGTPRSLAPSADQKLTLHCLVCECVALVHNSLMKIQAKTFELQWFWLEAQVLNALICYLNIENVPALCFISVLITQTEMCADVIIHHQSGVIGLHTVNNSNNTHIWKMIPAEDERRYDYLKMQCKLAPGLRRL